MDTDFAQEDLDKLYMEEYRTFHDTLEQMNVLFKNDPMCPIRNKAAINFRTPIPFQVQTAYNNATQNLFFFLHKNLSYHINRINLSAYPSSNSKSMTKQSPPSIMVGLNKKISQIINELAMSIFFSPIPEEKILNEYLNKVESSLKYFFKNLSQTNQPLNYDSPFLSSILRIFTFTAILYAVARENELEVFIQEFLNIDENDSGRLIVFHRNEINSLIQNFLRTPNQYSIRFSSKIKNMSEKLESLLRSVEVFRDEFVAKPLNEEIEYNESEKVLPISLEMPSLNRKNDRNNEKLNENDIMVHINHLFATNPYQNPFGKTLQGFDSISIKKKPNRNNYVLFDYSEVDYFHHVEKI